VSVPSRPPSLQPAPSGGDAEGVEVRPGDVELWPEEVEDQPEQVGDRPEEPTDLRPPAALDDERRALRDLVVYAYDRTTSAGVRARLAEGLRTVGVEVVAPDGEPFDPARHEAGGTEPTTDPDRHGTVAETEVVGLVDRGLVVRDPVVVVYRLSEPHRPR
jgi:hypothetical protein